MPIYTKTGDDGETGLFGNQRVPKEDLRIEAYGTVDEVNSVLGLLRTEALPADLDDRLREVQSVLFDIGAELATPGERVAPGAVRRGVTRIEGWIDQSEAGLPPLRNFVLPGGHREAALFHLLRTTTRRAERLVWALHRRDGVAIEIGIYLNRLSDLCFSLARQANHRHGIADVPWVRTEA